jgi:excisionase family DNA binding protein
MNADLFLTTDQVLEQLQLDRQAVYRLINAGEITAVRVGRQWLFRRSDVDAWRNAALERPPEAGEDRVAARPRILVVDDEDTVRDLIARALLGAGYDVAVAANGPAALERLAESGTDLLITDLRMPGMDGLSLIREARKTAPGLPVIVITGFSTEETAADAVALGVAGYLTKPFRLSRILAATARALGEPVPAAEASPS